MTPTSSLALVAALLAVPCSIAIEYTVKTCAELADVDDTLVTGLTIDSSTFACDEYTRFRVRNEMFLKATGPTVAFDNFAMKVLGELTVEPDVTFTGVNDEVVNGGVLYVAEGATATFLGTAVFTENYVDNKELGGERTGQGLSYVIKKGGAIHNKGVLSFEGDARFDDNLTFGVQGKGGAISNTGSGSIFFKGDLSMRGNEADGDYEGAGAAVYNRGEITVDGETRITYGWAPNGSGIYNTKIGKITFKGMATFAHNESHNFLGGAICNRGGIVTFEAGSLFEDNFADRSHGSGDGGAGGAIFNGDGGVVTFTGPTTFKENRAYWGGAIYTSNGVGLWSFDGPASTTIFPDDTVFIDNISENCDDVNNGDVDNGEIDGCPVV